MYDTVDAHLEAGRITARPRATADDLELAVTWLEAYEGDPEDETLTTMATAAAFLRREIERRERQAAPRAGVATPAVPPPAPRP